MSLRPYVLAYLEKHRSVYDHYSPLLHANPLLGVRAVYKETCVTDAQKQEFIGALLKDTNANLLLTIDHACPPNSLIRQWLCTPGPATERGAFICEFRSLTQLFEFAVGSPSPESHEATRVSCRMFDDVVSWLSTHDGVDPEVHLAGAQVCDPLRNEFIVYRCCPYDDDGEGNQKTGILMSMERWLNSETSTSSPPSPPIRYRNVRKRKQQKRASARQHASLAVILHHFVHPLF